MSSDIKLSKVQINKIIKEGGNLGRLLMSFLPKLIKPAISIGKNILAPLGLSAAISDTNAAIQKKMYGSGITTLIIYNDDINDLIKIVTALEEHDIMEKIKDKNIKSNIFRIQDDNSIICGYFCILFIEYMLNNKTLTDFTNLFSPWDLKKNEIIKKYFK